jgi:hypothetical protein
MICVELVLVFMVFLVFCVLVCCQTLCVVVGGGFVMGW